MAQLPRHRPVWAGGLLCLVLTTGCAHQLSARPATPAPAAPSTAPPPTALAAPAPPEASPAVPAPAAQIAAAFVTALNTHDARAGHDHGLHDANARTRPYVTDQVYAQIADPQTRNSAALWQQLVAAGAVTTVRVDRVAVPEGAPAPTAQQAEVRVTYTVTTTGQTPQSSAQALATPGMAPTLTSPAPGAQPPTTQTLSQAMQVTATSAGWRIDQLLAF